MPTDKKASDKWAPERKALKKIQVHIEMRQQMVNQVRVMAAQRDLVPTDFIRSVIGLQYSSVQRPRISLSFSEQDLTYLSECYGIPAAETGQIKRRVQEDVLAHIRKGGQ